ncbi:nicotinate (nicotinamide) nucleotide adenylyltransferase [Ureaplasma canigenitalium]|uniref:nicotinate (nicotinamide) nucleotide adenylyltransferase n=1 Tax=Ureaplasma canigenitalium TaxID=42092 RepID=UPI000AD6A8F4|nr:nicotinate (nicotinamide) nucleotide adenylyltransferase [Ureaplasma canigenitalium]
MPSSKRFLKKKVILFPGMFDMVHSAHLEMANDALRYIHAKNCIFILSNHKFFRQPKKYETEVENFIEMKKNEVAPLNDRKKMLHLALSNKKVFKVSTIEKKMNFNYTIDTINYFTRRYQNIEFYMIIGQDQMESFHKWKDYQTILEKVKIICYQRKQECFVCHQTMCHCSSFLYENHKIIYRNLKNYQISSTNIKNNFNGKYLNKKVFKYIIENGLYAVYLLYKHNVNLGKGRTHFSRLDRVYHGFRVGSYAQMLASIHCPRLKKKAYVAGLYHDLFKSYDEEQTNYFYQKWNIEKYITDVPSYRVLHGYLASHYLVNYFNLKDQEIINAIKNHTIPNMENPSMLDQILFVADKLECKRNVDDFENIKDLRILSKIDLNSTYNEIVACLKKKDFS